MLDTMRRHSESFLIYLIFGALIVVFAINFGPGSGSCRPARTGYAAIVDGDVIPQQSFAMQYQRRVDALRRRAQAKNVELTNDMIERMGIKTQVLDTFITAKLLAHEAERHGLTVSPEELVSYLSDALGIRDITPEQYKNFVENNFGTTVPRFEQSVREDLLARKMQEVFDAGISVSDSELEQDFLREHNRVMITYVKVDPEHMDVAEPTQAQLDELLAKDMPAVEKRYNEQKLRYRTPMRVDAREIVIKLPKAASDAEVAKARGQLLDLKSQIEGGADFAALAKEKSQDAVTAQKGGDMGELTRGKLPPALDNAIFALKKGEITAEPVRAGDAMHLVQVTDVHAPAIRPLDEVKQQVAAEVLQQRAGRKIAEQRASEILAKLEAGTAIEELTADAGTAPSKTGGKPVRHDSPWVLESQDGVPAIGSTPELHDAIFALSTENPLVKKPLEVNGAFYVIKLKERETPDMSKLAGEKDSLRKETIQVKTNRVMREWIEYLRQKAKIEYNPSVLPSNDRAA